MLAAVLMSSPFTGGSGGTQPPSQGALCSLCLHLPDLHPPNCCVAEWARRHADGRFYFCRAVLIVHCGEVAG